MMAKDARLKEERMLLDAIGKVRAQKQRPNIERIYAIMQQQCRSLTVDEVACQLDNALKSRAIVRLESKGGISYRDALMHRSDAEVTSNHDLSALVMSAIRRSVTGCTFEQLEKSVRKSLQPSNKMETDSLRGRINLLCHKLVSDKHMLVQDGLYSLYKSKSPLRTSAADSADGDDGLSSTTMSCSKNSSIRNLFCAICRREEDDNGGRTLVTCADCSYTGHIACLKLSPNLARSASIARWQCYTCKTCSGCGDSGKKIRKPADVLVCGACDRVFHSECCRPPTLAERASSDCWLCSDCCTDAVRADADPYQYIADADRKHRQYRNTGDRCVISSDIDIATAPSYMKFRPDSSCTSEAVVGSSSDVTKSRTRRASGDYTATSSSRQSSGSLSPQSDSTYCDLIAKSSGAPRGLVDALSQYFTPSDKRRSRVSLNALPPHAVVQQSQLLDTPNCSRAVVADTTRRDDCALPSTASRSPLRNWKKARHLPNPNQGGSCTFNNNVAISSPSSHTDAESTYSNDYGHRELADHGDRLSVVKASVTSESSSINLKSTVKNTSMASHHNLHHSTVKVRRLSENFPLYVKTKKDDVGAFSEKRKTIDSVESSTNSEDRCRSNSFSESQEDLRRKRYRRTQLSALQDSLSHNFIAEGERKRTMRLTDYNIAAMFDEPVVSKRKRKSRSLSDTRQRKDSSSTMNEATENESNAAQVLPKVLVDVHSNCSSSAWTRSFISEPNIKDDDVTVFEASQTANKGFVSQEDVRLPKPLSERRTVKATFGSHRWNVSVSATRFTDVARLESVNICECCLKVYGSYRTMSRHARKCTLVHRMMGNEIYRQQNISVYEVDGSIESTYCHGLSLLMAILGSDSTTCADISACDLTANASMFYVLMSNTKDRCPLIGFFSKNISCQEREPLSNLLILPKYRGVGYDIFLIDLSYKLNQLEGITESGALPQPNIVSATGINSVDIMATLKQLNLLSSPIVREIVEINQDRIAELAEMKRTDYSLCFDSSNLRPALHHAVVNERRTQTFTRWYDVCIESHFQRDNSQVKPMHSDVALENNAPLSNRHKVGRPKGSCKLSSKKSVEDKNPNKRRPGRPPKVKVSTNDLLHRGKHSDDDLLCSTLHSNKLSKVSCQNESHNEDELSLKKKLCSTDIPFPSDMPLLKRGDQSIADSDSDDMDRSPSPPTLEQVDVPGSVSECRDGTEINVSFVNSIDRLSSLDAEADVLVDSRICTKDLFEHINVDIDTAIDDKVSVDESLSLDKSDIEDLEIANRSNFDSFDELKASEDESVVDGEGNEKAEKIGDDVFMGNSSLSTFSSVLNDTKKDISEADQLKDDDSVADKIEEKMNVVKSVKDFSSDSDADELNERKSSPLKLPDSQTPSLSSSTDESDASLSSDFEDKNENISSVVAADVMLKAQSIESDLKDMPSEVVRNESSDIDVNTEGKTAKADNNDDVDEQQSVKEYESLKTIVDLNTTEKPGTLIAGGLAASLEITTASVCETNVLLPPDVVEEATKRLKGCDVAGMVPNNVADEAVVSCPVFKSSESFASSDPLLIMDKNEKKSLTSLEMPESDVAKPPGFQRNEFVQGLSEIYSAKNIEGPRSVHMQTGNLSNVAVKMTAHTEPFHASQSVFTFDQDQIKSHRELLHGSHLQQALVPQDLDRASIQAKSTCPTQFVPPSVMLVDQRAQHVSSYSSSEAERRIMVTAVQQSQVGPTHSVMAGSPGRVNASASNASLFHSGMSGVSSPGCNARGGTAVRAGVGGPCLEPNSSSYSANYVRLSVGSGLQPHPGQQMASPASNTTEMGMPSPKHYYVDFNMSRQAAYSSMPPCTMVQEVCYPTTGGASVHSVKGSPCNYTETKVTSPASGCTLMSPSANTGRTHFSIPCRSPASRADQSSTSVGNSAYGNNAGGSSATGSRQVNYNRPNPSPSSQASKRNSGGSVGGSRLNQSPLQINVFSPTTAAESSPGMHMNCLSIPPSSVMSDVGLPFHFPSNNVVAVPVTASSYASIPSPTPRSLQLLSPSISIGAGNGIISVGGYQRQGQHHLPAPQFGASLQHRPSSANYQPQHQPASALGLLGYNNVTPVPSSQVTYAAARMLDHRFAPDVDTYDQRVAPPGSVGRQARNPRSAVAPGQPSNGSLAKLQQLTNQLESERVSQRHQAVGHFEMPPYGSMSMSGGPTMLLAQNVVTPGLADPLMSGIQMNSAAPSVATLPTAKPSGRRRAAGVSANKSVAPPNATPMHSPFSTNMAVAGYNMLSAFPHSSYQHGHQQTRSPSPFDYQHYLATNAAAAAAGFFNSGGSQLPMQMMHFGMPHTRAQVAAAANAASGFPQTQSMQGGQVNNPVYPPYGYGGVPPDSFNNSSCR